METSLTCPFCGTITDLNVNFCPNCGKTLKEKPISTTTLTQIGIYLLSFFLPPLGLWPAFRYLRQADRKAKQIGGAAVVITILSVIVTVWTVYVYVTAVGQAVNREIQMYQTPGL